MHPLAELYSVAALSASQTRLRLNIIAINDITRRKRRIHIRHSRTFVAHSRDHQLALDAALFGRRNHGPRHDPIGAFLFTLRKNVATGTSGNGHDGGTSAREIGTGGARLFRRVNHGKQVLVEFAAALGLMQFVFDTPTEIVEIAHAKCVH